MKNTTKSVKSSKSKFAARKPRGYNYSESERKDAAKLLRTHTNKDVRRKLGFGVHWLGALRRELKIKPVEFVPNAKGNRLLDGFKSMVSKKKNLL